MSGLDQLSLADPYTVPTTFWHRLPDGRVQCDACPRGCRLHEGQRGFCYVRGRVDDQIVLASYGRSSGFCVDPIEKKPLNHFLPGSPVLSFGTAGCNLGCRFCQNWDISTSREIETLSASASPDAIAATAERLGCRSVAFTYNDPVIFIEYAIDVAEACHDRGISAVAVSAGYQNPEPRAEFYRHIDAANIDLKAFTDEFYTKITLSNRSKVLDTLEYLATTGVWFEITTLLIPGYNDAEADLAEQAAWHVERLGPDVPLHFSAFHPDFKMRDVPATPPKTLRTARQIALDHGVRFVYTGNVHDKEGQTTFCPSCGEPVIVRDWYLIDEYSLDGHGRCGCGAQVPGRFDGPAGTWGPRRYPVSELVTVPVSSARRDRRVAGHSEMGGVMRR